MNYGELIKAVASETGQTEASARQTISATFEAIANAAREGDDSAIPGFGKFLIKHRPAREGRNPRTGEPMKIKASRTVSFKAAKGLKDAL